MFGLINPNKLNLAEKLDLLNLDGLELEELLEIKRLIDSKVNLKLDKEDYFNLSKNYKKFDLYIEYTRRDKKRYIDKIKFILSEDNILLGITDKINVDFYIGVVDHELNVLLLSI